MEGRHFLAIEEEHLQTFVALAMATCTPPIFCTWKAASLNYQLPWDYFRVELQSIGSDTFQMLCVTLPPAASFVPSLPSKGPAPAPGLLHSGAAHVGRWTPTRDSACSSEYCRQFQPPLLGPLLPFLAQFHPVPVPKWFTSDQHCWSTDCSYAPHWGQVLTKTVPAWAVVACMVLQMGYKAHVWHL